MEKNNKNGHGSVLKMALLTGLLAMVTQANAIQTNDLLHGHLTAQLGYYWSLQGQAQNINIEGTVGDLFTLANGQESNGLFGLGYYVDGQTEGAFNMSYGLNFFYLGPTGVSGAVIQEHLFTNLTYSYKVSHIPLYLMAKSTIDTNSTRYGVTVDVGIGPNFTSTGSFKETNLDGGRTDPDLIFSGKNSTTFSATAGIGLKFNNIFGAAPLECGYRFFYLGEAGFNKVTNQTINTLGTGSNFGNAVICAITI